MSHDAFRFNVVDGEGTSSFTGPAHGLKVIAAGCAHNPVNLGMLLDRVERYDQAWVRAVRAGLRVFDEHNVEDVSSAFSDLIASGKNAIPPFRILDQASRNRSMQPEKLGLVVVNLRARRIIQVHNTYAELQRSGRGRIRKDGRPTRVLFRYTLPEAWRIVP